MLECIFCNGCDDCDIFCILLGFVGILIGIGGATPLVFVFDIILLGGMGIGGGLYFAAGLLLGICVDIEDGGNVGGNDGGANDVDVDLFFLNLMVHFLCFVATCCCDGDCFGIGVVIDADNLFFVV